MATTLASQVQELYVGYLGRAADKAGLDFWVKAIESGTSTLESVALGFTLSEEYKAQYNGLTTTQLVAKVYQNVLGRAADADGLAFWAGEVNKGVIKADTLVKTMIGSLGAIDQLTIDNKVAAANAYTIAAGEKYSVEAGKAAVVNAGTTVPGTSTPGQTFTLTTGADVLSPNSATAATKTTIGDDLIRAVIDNSLQTLDVIDGGAGVDTLKANLSLAGNAGTTAAGAAKSETVQPVLANVEKVYVNATVTGGKGSDTTDSTAGGAATLKISAKDSSGIQELWSEGSTVTNGASGSGATTATVGGTAALQFVDVKLGTVVGVKDSAGAVTFEFAAATGGADAATLALADSTAAVTINAIENLTINSIAGDLSGVTSNSVALTANALTSLNVTGSQALTLGVTLTGGATELKTIDASAATGAVTLTTTAAATNSLTVKGGSGADTINLSSASGKAHTVEAGAGADTVTLLADKAHKVTGGEGKDTFVFDTVTGTNGLAAADITTASKLAAAVITITDFVSGTDLLRVDASATTVATLTGTNQSAVASQTDLLLAVNKALELSSDQGAARTLEFQYGSDTYVLVNNNADNILSAGDALIKLSGVADIATADLVVF